MDAPVVAAPALHPPASASASPPRCTYGFHCELKGLGFDDVIAQVTTSLQAEGFGVLTDIDVQATLKAKLGLDMPRHRILGACNPGLAHHALSAEPDIGLLLPCNVVVRQVPESHIVVAFMDPVAVMQLTTNPEVDAVAQEVRTRLQRVRAALVRDLDPPQWTQQE